MTSGVLLVGGASTRFGAPKALVRFQAETLAERAWRTLGEGCDERLAVGKAGELELPFPVLDDGTDARAPLAGVVAGLNAATHELCVVLPVDCPLVTVVLLQELAGACHDVDATVPQTGPLPGAYRRTALPDQLREGQGAFAATGGLHATGLFDRVGGLLCVREDVGRHNAMDKIVGRAFGDGSLPLAENVLCVSGRLSFELVQKAAVAGCPLLVAVGAPSSLAVDLAADRGITLCGFVRRDRMNVYTEPWRIER